MPERSSSWSMVHDIAIEQSIAGGVDASVWRLINRAEDNGVTFTLDDCNDFAITYPKKGIPLELQRMLEEYGATIRRVLLSTRSKRDVSSTNATTAGSIRTNRAMRD